MTEKQAKRQLARMLRSYTAGSVLHLLADLYRSRRKTPERPTML